MFRKSVLTTTCLSLFAVPAFAAPNSNTTHTEAAIQRIDNAKNFLSDRFTVNGVLRVRADGEDTAAQYTSVANPDSRTESHINLEVWLGLRLYKDWTLKTQLEPQYNLRTGKMNGDQDIPMNKLYIEGSLANNMKLRVGKYGAFSSYGRVFDNEVTGAELTFNNSIAPTKLAVARFTKLGFNDNPWGVGVHRNGTVIVQSKYPLGVNTNVGGTVAYVQDVKRQDGSEKDAWFGEVGVDTKLGQDWSGFVAYSRSNIDDTVDRAGKKVVQDSAFAEVKFKNADWETVNSYDVYANARYVGAMSGVSSVSDYSKNVKGIQVGANYVPYKNLKVGAFYLHGKQVNATVPSGEKQNVNVWRAQAEYKF